MEVPTTSYETESLGGKNHTESNYSRISGKDCEAQGERYSPALDATAPKSARVLEILAEMDREPSKNQGNDEGLPEDLGESTVICVVEESDANTSSRMNRSANNTSTHEENTRKQKLTTQGIIPKCEEKFEKSSTYTVGSEANQKQSTGQTTKMSVNPTGNSSEFSAEDGWVVFVVDEENKDTKSTLSSGTTKTADGADKMATSVANAVTSVCSVVAVDSIDHFPGIATSVDDVEPTSSNKNAATATSTNENRVTTTSTSKNTIPGEKKDTKEKKTRERVYEKIMTCALCSRQYDCRARLITHLRTHTGDKPYSCDICGFKSVRKYNLTAHKLTLKHKLRIRKHKSVGKMASGFSTIGDIEMVSIECSPDIDGVSEHTPSVVTAISSCKNTIPVKRKLHAQGMVFTCAICGSEYDRRRSLIVHLKTHTERACDKRDGTRGSKHNLMIALKLHSKKHPNRLRLNVATKTAEGVSKKADKMDSGTEMVSIECSPDIEEAMELARSAGNAKATCTGKNKISDKKREPRVREKIFICAICNRKYDRKSRLIIHLRTHTAESKYACDECDYRTSRKQDLTAHKLTHFQEDTKSTHATPVDDLTVTCRNPMPNERQRKNKKSKEKVFPCAFCSNKYDRKSRLMNHLSTHTGEKRFSCDECDYKTGYKHNLLAHKLTHSTEKMYSCDECSFETNSKRTMEAHKRNHKGEKPFACDVCEYRSSDKYMLTLHKVSHTDERPYGCTTCAYQGKDTRALNAHMKTHTDEKRFKCPFCDYACHRSVKLKDHVRTHTGEKPYACDKCDYTCAHVASLKTHMWTHTDEKRFSCTICDFKCRQATHLKIHMTNHTNKKLFSCTICQYSTSISSHYKNHMIVHRDERPYECDSCNKKFRVGSHLKRHMVTVHRNRPYCCDACNYECNDNAVLQDHLRNCYVRVTCDE